MVQQSTTESHLRQLKTCKGAEKVAIQTNSTSSMLSTTGATKANQQMVLRPGQIILGKVQQLFPNQKAVVQLGNQQVIAQLQTPLEVDATYLFQVHSTDDLPQLKVLAENQAHQSIDEQITELLKQLELPNTKENQQFVRSLIARDIPFRMTDIKQAIQLNQTQANEESREPIIEMLSRQLPITANTLRAINQQDNPTLRSQLEQLNRLTTVTKTGTSEVMLQTRIQSLLGGRSDASVNTAVATIVQQVEAGDDGLVQLLKQAGIINKDINPNDIVALKNQLTSAMPIRSEVASQTEKTVKQLATLYQNQLPIPEQKLDQLQKYSSLAAQTPTNAVVTKQALESLQALLRDPVLSLKTEERLPEQTKPVFANWKSEPIVTNLQSLLGEITDLYEQQLSKPNQMKLFRLLVNLNQANTLHAPNKHQVIEKAKQFLTFSGVDFDYQIPDKQEHQQSVKQLIFQTLQVDSVSSQGPQKLIVENDEMIVDLLKQAGIVGKETNPNIAETLKNRLINTTPSRTESIPQLEQSAKQLANLFQKQLPISQQQLYQMQKYTSMATQAPTNSDAAKQALESLQTLLRDPVVSLKIEQRLPEQAKPLFAEWKSEPTMANLQKLLPELTELSEQQVAKGNQPKLVNMLANLSQMNEQNLPIKDQFLLQAKQFMQFSGVDYEHRIVNEQEQQQSLKQLVLQSLQTGSGPQSELETLLHTINGLQLASVQEDNTFMQASIQIPGMFGMEKNIELEFHSKKGEDGQIDADYCRIAFFLELTKIGATTIDMSIQNRIINITVINDNEEIVTLLNRIKPLLQEGLTKNNYQLSSVKYQPFSEVERTQVKATQTKPKNSYQGVDYRI